MILAGTAEVGSGLLESRAIAQSPNSHSFLQSSFGQLHRSSGVSLLLGQVDESSQEDRLETNEPGTDETESEPTSNVDAPDPDADRESSVDNLVESNQIGGDRAASDLVLTEPTAFVIKGRKGGFWINRQAPLLRRNLTLRFTNPPKSIKVYVSDLKDPDGDKIYSAEYTTCETGMAESNPFAEQAGDTDHQSCHGARFPAEGASLGEIFSMHFHFSLYLKDKETGTFVQPPSGEFSGEILIVPEEGKDIIIPVLLRVQDGWMLPLFILLSGVGMGMAVSAYSSGGRLSDEVTVGLNRLQAQIDQYRHSAKAFASRTETYIADARSANEAQQLEEAQQAVSQAKAIWRKWYRQRTEWDAQFAYHSRLTQQVRQEMEHYESLYMQTINRELDNMMHRAPEEFTDPGDLRTKLQDVANMVREYGQLKTRWNQLKELVSDEFEKIAIDEQKQINTDISQIKQIITSLLPSDAEGIEALKTQLNDLINTVKSAADTTLVPDFSVAVEEASSKQKVEHKRLVSRLTMIPSPTAVHPIEETITEANELSWTERLKTLGIWPDADGRLRFFYISSYIGSVVMLASVGFSSLYVENPTFGSDFFADYFSLIAWGFGAEATRDTVTKVVRKTDETNK